jgi:hypothetical protein
MRRWLLTLYPAAWRERYGDEMAALLAAQPLTLRLVLNLIAGAIDARLEPTWLRTTAQPIGQGDTAMSKLLSACQPEDFTRAEQLRSAGWMLGGTVVLTAIYIALKRQFGEIAIIEAFGFSLFPTAVTLSMRSLYLKRYSAAAASVIMFATIVIVFGMSLVAVLVSERL